MVRHSIKEQVLPVFRNFRASALFLLLVLTVTVPTVMGGGFGDASRALLVALAGATLLLAYAIDGRSVTEALRAPLAMTLLALAVLSAASGVWTLAEPAVALRWGLVIGSYAAVFIAAATLTRNTGLLPVALTIAGLAVLEALVGLRAVALHDLPNAERIDGVWRAGGTFQYPPALAILEVGALPILACTLARARAPLAAAAAVATVLAGTALALARSRLCFALLAALLLGLVLRRPFALIPGDARARVAAAGIVMLVLLGGLLSPLLINGDGSHRDVLHGRAHEWQAAAETWLDRPLLGAGAGAYYLASLPHQGPTGSRYAHNLPLELASELGILGLLLGVALYVASGLTLFNARGGPAAWLLGPLVVAFLVSNLLDWTWHLAGLAGIWAAASGALYGAGQALPEEARNPPPRSPQAIPHQGTP